MRLFSHEIIGINIDLQIPRHVIYTDIDTLRHLFFPKNRGSINIHADGENCQPKKDLGFFLVT